MPRGWTDCTPQAIRQRRHSSKAFALLLVKDGCKCKARRERTTSSSLSISRSRMNAATAASWNKMAGVLLNPVRELQHALAKSLVFRAGQMSYVDRA
ncbi:hypothetical protein KC353_g13 [Hortaea werneckii]|nr:hypothetical protein KC353_g13 [Hortaea werneckii]